MLKTTVTVLSIAALAAATSALPAAAADVDAAVETEITAVQDGEGKETEEAIVDAAEAVETAVKEGVELDDGPVAVSSVKVVAGRHGRNQPGRSVVELVIHEGRNRIVRRLLAHVGHPVKQLTRTRIGPVQLGRLGVGEIRDLTSEELGLLLDSAQL